MMHSAAQMHHRGIMLSGESHCQKITYCMVPLCNLLEMLKLQRKKADQWLTRVRDGEGRGVCETVKRQHEGDLCEAGIVLCDDCGVVI